MLWNRQRTERAHRQCFNRLVASEIDAIHRTAYRLCQNSAEAEDLVQEVFLRAWKSIAELVQQENARPWLFRVLRNAWIDRLRKSARRPQMVHLDESVDQTSPEIVPVFSPMDDRSNWEEFFDAEVTEAMYDLPEAERQVLFYYTYGELSYQEVAEALECPIGTVMSRLHRARRRLQQRLAAYAARRGIHNEEERNHASS